MPHQFKRDKSSGALINTDVSGLKGYKIRKQKAEEQAALNKRVLSMENDISQIKTMLEKLIND